MTKSIKRILIAALSIAFVFAACATLGFTNKASAEETAQWTGGFTATEENGETVYTANTNSSRLDLVGDVGANNKIDFKFRPNAGGGDLSDFYFYIGTSDKTHYVAFRIYYYWRAVAIIDFTYDFGSSSEILAAVNYADNGGGNWNGYDAWHDVSVEFNAKQYVITVDGGTATAQNTQGYTFVNGAALFSVWNEIPSIKDMKFSVASDWYGNVDRTTENGDIVYNVNSTCNNNQWIRYIDYIGTAGDVNTFEFSFRPNAECAGDTANITFVLSNGSAALRIAFLNYWKAVLVSFTDAQGNQTHDLGSGNYPVKTDSWTGYDIWYNVKIQFESGAIAVYINGDRIFASGATNTFAFQNLSYGFTTWGELPSVKGMKLYNSTLAEGLYGYYAEKPEGTENVLTAYSSVLAYLNYKGSTEGVTGAEFYFRPSNVCHDDTANLSLYVSNGEQTLRFAIQHYWKAIILYTSANGGDETQINLANYVAKVNGWNNEANWYKFDIRFESGMISVYCDDVRVFSTGADYGFDFTKAINIYFSSWGCVPSVKGFRLLTDAAPAGWYGNYGETYFGNYNEQTQSSESVYTADSVAFTLLYYKGDMGDVNTVEFAFRPNATWNNDVTANLSFSLSTGDIGFRIEFQNYWKALFIHMFNADFSVNLADITVVNYPVKTDSWTGYDVWYNVEFRFAPKALLVYVNGDLLAYSCTDYEVEFKNLSCFFSDWGEATSIKDIKLSKTQFSSVHKPVTDDAVAATCTLAGLTEGSHCSECGEVIVAQQPTEALGHDMTHVEATAATCAEAGNIEYWYCEVCKKYFADANGETETTIEATVTEALGHDYEVTFEWTKTSSGYTVTATATCKTDGTTENVNAIVTAEKTDNGKRYTATVTVNGKEYVEEKDTVSARSSCGSNLAAPAAIMATVLVALAAVIIKKRKFNA